MVKLGVNIDHVATIREARKTFEPDPAQAVHLSEEAGCTGIVCHLRKDRRHVNEADMENIKKAVTTELNMEMSVDPEIVDIAVGLKPDRATLVPENRMEITTEGGLDVVRNFDRVKAVVEKLAGANIEVSLFIDPTREQVLASARAGVKMVEFHTGKYAEIFASGGDYSGEMGILSDIADFTVQKGIIVCAGHGLTYSNVEPVAGIDKMYELNIGHSIISSAVFTGIFEAVKEMRRLIP